MHSNDKFDLDFVNHFSADTAAPEPAHTPQELKQIDDMGSIGASTLKDRGYYVRIVSARTRDGRPLPQHPVVLVAEDDPGTSMVIVKALQSFGYATRAAEDRAGIAKALAEEPHPDLILLDVMLKDINGFDVLNRIRRHSIVGNTPVIMLTSLSESGDVAKGLGLGADAYLSKPVLPSTLLDAVQAVLGG